MIKKYNLSITLLVFSLLLLSLTVCSAEKAVEEKEQLIEQVEQLFSEDEENLNYDDVLKLSNKIIIRREKYSNEIIGKTYLLLAHVTSNNGELESAYQFTLDGLAAVSGQEQIRVCLQIKLANILSDKKQYKHLLDTAQQTIDLTKSQENIKYLLFALSYRSVAYAMLNQHQLAFDDLQKVESLIEENESFAEHISLLTILANTYYHLGDYHTALTMHLKIIQLRFRLKRLNNIDQTYYHLANTFYRLNRLNDAYNAYWESKRYAENKGSKIHSAYASQGLGLTLIKQQQFTDAKSELLDAKELFYQQNLTVSYLETLISLILLNQQTKEQSTTTALLIEAEELATNVNLTDDYIIIYQLFADYYKNINYISKAFYWQKKYSNALFEIKKTAMHTPLITNKNISAKSANTIASAKTRDLAIKLAEQSESANAYAAKHASQKTYIIILVIIVIVLLFTLTFMLLINRATKLNNAHAAIEKANDVIATPAQTKELYQKNFNMARKYNYPLTLSYISISNWQELSFQFNKKIVAEVSKEIASVINKHLNDFENAGLINEGEYLLIFPHQNKKDVAKVIDKLVLDLKLRFFANLGDFSVVIAYSTESPNYQDIDPYIYLSQLSDSIKIA